MLLHLLLNEKVVVLVREIGLRNRFGKCPGCGWSQVLWKWCSMLVDSSHRARGGVRVGERVPRCSVRKMQEASECPLKSPNRKEVQTTLGVLFGSARLWEDSFTDLHGSLFPHLRSIRSHETSQPSIRAMVEQPEQPGDDGAVYRTIPQLRNDPR